MVVRIILFLIMSSYLIFSSGCKQEQSNEKGNEVEESVKVPLGDPFIMLHEDIYYAYGTFSDNGIAVFTSTDLKTWSIPKDLTDGLALRKSDVWGDRWFWAPEVYYVNDKFYMYYSANEHICVATSDSPLGPFTQEVQEPMISDEKCIDNSLFFDENGKPWLYFDRFNDGLNIWVAELTEDLLQIKFETMQPCIHVSQEWEQVWPRVNEGAFVIQQDGLYYMIYSANSFESQFYGVGFATSDSPVGPWTKYEGNPIMQKPGELVGVGHSAIFMDKEGDLKIVFHAHKDTANIHPRSMYIGSVGFEKVENAVDVMVIDENYMVPVLDVK